MSVFIPPSLFSFVPHHNVLSTWDQHTPFGYDLVGALRPSTVVELGTFSGMSFFCFCQSMTAHEIDGHCYAVDIWEGDQQNGYYNDDVYEQVRDYARRHYADRAHLMRMRFNEAAAQFEGETIDLLHIDGLHTYEAVSEDFSTWYPKVSPGGVVLIHDICARVDGFGVWQFWNERAPHYESFAFHHGFGLGVLRKPGGERNANPLLDLLFSEDVENGAALRLVYAQTAKYMALRRRFSRTNHVPKPIAPQRKRRSIWRMLQRAA